MLPYQEIFLISLGFFVFSSFLYRILTKPAEMRQIKKDMKFYREKSKEAQKQKDMKKANEHMSEMMKLSQKQMRNTMKPMFVTMGVALLLIGYILQSYGGIFIEMKPAGENISTGQFSYAAFSYPARAEKINDQIKITLDINGNGDFSDDTAYSKDDLLQTGSLRWSVEPLDMNKTQMNLAVAIPFTLPVFGWTYMSLIMWYILVSFPVMWISRKMLGVE